MQYTFREIEKKWQRIWNETQAYKVSNDTSKPKCYVLDMFPYPSGAGLHVGHPLGYIASDIYARYKRLKGYNVLHPMGFDSFGLPAEQYAIETGQHPAVTTEKNIARYKEQLNNIGFCFDWSREVKTSDPSYYKWTQWIFLQLYTSWYNPETNKAEPIEGLIKQNIEKGIELSENDLMKHRLAYRAESLVNWCEALGTVLANDEVVNGVSERGGHPVERKLMSQWFLRITSFAERLLDGLNRVDFPESLKEMQRNWIGRSEGAELSFQLQPSNSASKNETAIHIFTTRPDTIFGVSFLVLAPEHPLVQAITSDEQRKEITDYQKYVSARSERDRLSETKKVTGAFTGAYAIHPFTGNNIPIWIADYVLMGYGTGAIMAVPCGDSRDYAFAKHFNIDIPAIFENKDISEQAYEEKDVTYCASDFINGLNYKDASATMLDEIEARQLGTRKINYRMRDAGFSRQRYWGEPFPIVYDAHGKPIALRENELPLELPYLETYSAGPNGKGPLANATEWMNSSAGVRETDTMPGYAGSSWYYLRYMDPHNEDTFCAKDISSYWNQVDVYIGGAEHAVGHLLYSRMWCKVLNDLGYVNHDEPYKKLINQGMIGGSSRFVYRINGTNVFISKNRIGSSLTPEEKLETGIETLGQVDQLHVDVTIVDGYELDLAKFRTVKNKEYADAVFILDNGKYICGDAVEKMSKSKYNVVNPDDIIEQYGTDTFRMYEMFLGPIEVSKPWDTKGIEGVHRFLRKLWRLYFDENQGCLVTNETASKDELKVLHQTIKKIEYDTENFAFNTAVSQFMICVNELARLSCNKKEILEPLLVLLTPFAPHISEELWQSLGHTNTILDAAYPILNESYLVENSFTYPVAINGKTRTEVEFALDADTSYIQETVLKDATVLKWMEDKPLKKFIYVKGKMINVVV
ncbi:MAG: leucine--tRNA ligase [Chitinophagaceae bacterium]|nr:leucine--tRNA ligase [Chitinophagaceae bacterium]